MPCLYVVCGFFVVVFTMLRKNRRKIQIQFILFELVASKWKCLNYYWTGLPDLEWSIQSVTKIVSIESILKNWQPMINQPLLLTTNSYIDTHVFVEQCLNSLGFWSFCHKYWGCQWPVEILKWNKSLSILHLAFCYL